MQEKRGNKTFFLGIQKLRVEICGLSHVKLGIQIELHKIKQLLKMNSTNDLTKLTRTFLIEMFQRMCCSQQTITIRNTSVLYLCTWFCPERI